MPDYFPVRLDISDFSKDPEFTQLLQNFVNAKMALENYLDRAMALKFQPKK